MTTSDKGVNFYCLFLLFRTSSNHSSLVIIFFCLLFKFFFQNHTTIRRMTIIILYMYINHVYAFIQCCCISFNNEVTDWSLQYFHVMLFILIVCSSNLWVCEQNPMVWPCIKNETILVVLSHGTILFSAFQDMEFGNQLSFDFWHFSLGEKQLTCALILLVSSKLSVLLRAKRLPYQI